MNDDSDTGLRAAAILDDGAQGASGGLQPQRDPVAGHKTAMDDAVGEDLVDRIGPYGVPALALVRRSGRGSSGGRGVRLSVILTEFGRRVRVGLLQTQPVDRGV